MRDEHCTGNAKVVDSNPVQSLKISSGDFSSSVMAAFASIIMFTFNCYCCTSITMDFFGHFILSRKTLVYIRDLHNRPLPYSRYGTGTGTNL